MPSMARSLTLILILITLLDSSTFTFIQRVKSDDIRNVTASPGMFLPGMKLGVNHRNGYIWSLSSSPGPLGSFTLSWEPQGRQLHISLGEVVYCSGVFKDGRFQYVTLSRYNFTVVSNRDEDSITYSTVDQTDRVSAWLLNNAGDLYDTYTGEAIAQADNCDSYSTDRGCHRRVRPTKCMATVGFDFQLTNAICDPIPSSARTPYYFMNGGYGISECKAACWKDCDCLGFDIPSNETAQCRFWSVDCQFEEDSGSGSGSSFVLSNPARKWIWIGTVIVSALLVLVILFACYLQIRRTGRRLVVSVHQWRWIGTGIAFAVLVMMFCIVCYLLKRRKFLISAENRRKIQNELLNLMKSNRLADMNGVQNDGKMEQHDLSVFSYASLVIATCNFSEENKLGEGGFGPVYKGKMVTGREIAVKRLSECSGQGTVEFKNELRLIYELQHTNLAQLFGFCIHGDERMLIYEYMPNRSLDYYLFDSTRALLLDWKTRFSIIEGIAPGLLYLHKYSRMQVIHRDLKASNILLDENMNPKISDFGIARIFTHNEREAKIKTKRIVGTYGYMSPEYAMGGIFSIKSDVYSFGVLMLEIISGRRNTSFYDDDRVVNTVGYAWELWKEGAELALKDPTLGDSCHEDQLLRCIQVGLLCVEENGADRPTMLEVISMLTSESMSLPASTKPAFCMERRGVRTGTAGKGSENMSINTMFNSDYDVR